MFPSVRFTSLVHQVTKSNSPHYSLIAHSPFQHPFLAPLALSRLHLFRPHLIMVSNAELQQQIEGLQALVQQLQQAQETPPPAPTPPPVPVPAPKEPKISEPPKFSGKASEYPLRIVSQNPLLLPAWP